MREIAIKHHIPEAKPEKDKKTNKDGYRIHDYYWFENGKKRKSDTHWHATRKECENEAKERILRAEDNAPLDKNTATLHSLILEYQNYIKNELSINDIAPSTKQNRIDNCNALIKHSSKEYLTKIKVSKLDVEVLKEWLNHLKNTAKIKDRKNPEDVTLQRPLSRDYYDGLKNLIKLILEYADGKNYFIGAQERYTSLQNFILNDRLKRKQPKREFRYLTFDEFKRFATCCLYDLYYDEDPEDVKIHTDFMIFNPHPQYKFEDITYANYVYFVFFCCMFYLGTRAEECRVLTWDDIDYEAGEHEGRITIDKAYTAHYYKGDKEDYLKTKKTKTSGSVRKIPIHPDLKIILQTYKKYLKDNELLKNELFPGIDNGYLSYGQINHKIERVLKASGMADKNFSKHDFRRSCAMYLCYDLRLPKENAIWFFGWTNTDMLNQVYSKFNEIQNAEILEEELNKVGFFKKEVPVFYMQDGKFYIGDEAKTLIDKKHNNEYRKYYNGTAKRKDEDD